MAKWKFNWLKDKAPTAADVALANAEAKSEGDVAAQAALQDLVKKEAEDGVPTQGAEAPAEAAKDTPETTEEEVLEVDAEGLAEVLTEIVTRLEAQETGLREAKEVKEAAVDLAPVEKGFADVNAAFAVVRKEHDTLAVQLKEANDKIDILAGALERLIGLQPKAAQKQFAVEYRASDAAETEIKKEDARDLVAKPATDAYADFAKWAGFPTQ